MEHRGIDLQSITRAGISLITNKGEITQGWEVPLPSRSSKIQVVAKQPGRKIKPEVLLAPALEQKYNKADIMEFYRNSNFYGNRCYGVETASKILLWLLCQRCNTWSGCHALWYFQQPK